MLKGRTRMTDDEPSNATEEEASAKQPTQPEADTDAPAGAAEGSNDNGNDDDDASPSDDVEMKAPEVAEQDGGKAAEGEEAAPDGDSGSKAVEATDTADSAAPAVAADADTAKENSDIANTAADADAGKKADETEGGKKAGTKRKDFEFELPSVPTKVKKARTAYFMFADEKRPGVVSANPGEPVGTIAKRIGELWSRLTPEEKAVYQKRSIEEKEQVARETVILREAGLLLDSTTAPGPGTATSGFILPVNRIRKIVKLDPEVKGLSKEGIHLITKAGELFVAMLGKQTVQVATMQNRRKLIPDDVIQVCETKPQYMFLQEDIKHLVEEQKEEHKKKGKAAEEAKTKAASETNPGVKPLTSFFAPSAPAVGSGEAKDD
mmetsp:Transcript_15990/g.32159  ORF Transcript_15990/g.32159 Transcript_15990/m.32159 type:complete len:379 (-) Transcript_15990:120-1256(-)